jgi:hypothetical protein
LRSIAERVPSLEPLIVDPEHRHELELAVRVGEGGEHDVVAIARVLEAGDRLAEREGPGQDHRLRELRRERVYGGGIRSAEPLDERAESIGRLVLVEEPDALMHSELGREQRLDRELEKLAESDEEAHVRRCR